FYQWIVDSQCTPILVIDANHPRCKIPQEYAEGGEIVFNISSAAIRDLKITNELVEFKASFSGVIHIISAPIKGILAVYAEENGEGIFFDAEEDDGSSTSVATLKPIEGSLSDSPLSERDIAQSGEMITKQKPFLKLVE
ncbi:MAG: hypothetical protein JO149_00765, partial [Gammaproteobacteria bacterium]|nr:hypothetical protein [Gammaproteobacteria bacterium]